MGFGQEVYESKEDQLFAGNVASVVIDSATITGGDFSRGTVLGMISASGKLTVVDSTKTDGSENPYAILCDDVVASVSDVVSPVYLTGEFNSAALVFGGDDTHETHKAEARKIGLFFKSVIPA